MSDFSTEIEAHIMLAAREHTERIFDRLVGIANSEAPMQVTVKAVKWIIKLLREMTSEEQHRLEPRCFRQR